MSEPVCTCIRGGHAHTPVAECPTHSAENDAACQSLSNVVPFGSDGRLRCLLFSPHDGYRHYAAMPDDWRRFWFWDDGDSVIPPGEGH